MSPTCSIGMVKSDIFVMLLNFVRKKNWRYFRFEFFSCNLLKNFVLSCWQRWRWCITAMETFETWRISFTIFQQHYWMLLVFLVCSTFSFRNFSLLENKKLVSGKRMPSVKLRVEKFPFILLPRDALSASTSFFCALITVAELACAPHIRRPGFVKSSHWRNLIIITPGAISEHESSLSVCNIVFNFQSFIFTLHTRFVPRDTHTHSPTTHEHTNCFSTKILMRILITLSENENELTWELMELKSYYRASLR